MQKMEFIKELKIFRQKKNQENLRLIAVADADDKSVRERIDEFEKSCKEAGVGFRTKDEKVALIIPKRNIETWVHYLKCNEFNETTDYKNMCNHGECRTYSKELAEICKGRKWDKEHPDSLKISSEEFRTRIV